MANDSIKQGASEGTGFSDDEKTAMRDRAKELKAEDLVWYASLC